MRQLFVLALLVWCSAPARSEPMAMAGVGSVTCSKFAQDFRRSTDTEVVYFTWAQGLMSGYNVSLLVAKDNARDLLAKPLDEQKAYLRSYCDRHPLQDYYQAVLNMYVTLPVVRPKQ